MPAQPLRVYFDFVDPLSYLQERELSVSELSAEVVWVGVELRPPPAPLTTVDDPVWAERWSEARALATKAGVELRPPELVPWTRKAHALHLMAGESGKAAAVRRAIFEAHFERGVDIGRVDRLVEIARAAGLDAGETKATLDVDRLDAEVAERREEAVASGVDDVPSIHVGTSLLRGFRYAGDLGTLLRDS